MASERKPGDEFLRWIGQEIGRLPEVQDVFVSRERDPNRPEKTFVRVETVLREDTVEARFSVYDREAFIGRIFPEDEFYFSAISTQEVGVGGG